MSEDKAFLAALAADAAGRQKQIAADAFPTQRIDVGEGDVSNQLNGRRRLTVATLLATMADPDRSEALAYLAERAGYRLERKMRDPDAVREECRERLRTLGEQVADVLEQLKEADRLGPLRARPVEREERRRA